MASIAIFGATGYAGGHLVRTALERGHRVTAVSRTPGPAGADTGRAGSITDGSLVADLAAAHDVLVAAVPAATLLDALPGLMTAVSAAGRRLGVVGGAGSLLVAEGGPKYRDTPGFQDAWRVEAEPHSEILDRLREATEKLDWFYLSPAAKFGRWAPGEPTGTYRTGGDVMLTDADGTSTISGSDYALAFVHEIETPRHRMRRFTVAN